MTVSCSKSPWIVVAGEEAYSSACGTPPNDAPLDTNMCGLLVCPRSIDGGVCALFVVMPAVYLWILDLMLGV